MKVENVSGGVSVTMTSKNPETAKRIQGYFAGGRMLCPGASGTQNQQDKK
jgi:hypothetical protein